MIYGHLDMITLATISFPILPWQIVSAPTPEKCSGLLVCNSQAELPEQQVYVCPECLGENKKQERTDVQEQKRNLNFLNASIH